VSYTAEEMLRIASEANVAKIMGENHSRAVTLDVIPARGQVIVPRLDPDDDSLTSPAPTIQTLTFHLEDAMFGTVCYAAITCQGKVIVNPFVWESWEHLAKARIGVG
jgi:hypothetical protein